MLLTTNNFSDDKAETTIGSSTTDHSGGNNNQTTTTKSILFFVNGKRYQIEISSLTIHKSLAEYLREDCQLTGTKIGCNEGGCGSCIVMLSKYQSHSSASNNCGRIVNYSVNACLYPLIHVDGCSVITIEGIKQDSILTLLKQRVVEFNALQCGFCTPGIIMSLYSQLRNSPKPSMKQIELCLDGNLCRCTGYRSILDMAFSFSGDADDQPLQQQQPIVGGSIGIELQQQGGYEGGGGAGAGCGNCNKEGGCCNGKSNNPSSSSSDQNDENVIEKEYLFPFELRNYQVQNFSYQDTSIEWYRPTSLDQLSSTIMHLNSKNSITKYIVGNSEVSLELRHRNCDYSHFISLTHIDELLHLNLDSSEKNQLVIGSSVTVQTLMEYLNDYMMTTRESITNSNDTSLRKIKTIIDQCKWFASTPIRNVASIGGNIITGSPISDLVPIWQSLNAQLTFLNVKTNEKRIVSIRNIFTGYRKLDISPCEILLYITIPNIETNSNTFCKAFKQSKRREDGIAIVNGCMTMSVDIDTHIIQDCSVSFGGMSFKVIYLQELCEFLIGKKLTDCNLLPKSLQLLNEQLKLDENVPGGQSLYRMSLSQGFLLKFITLVKRELKLPHEESIQSENHFLTKDKYKFEQFIEDTKLPSRIIDTNLVSQLNPVGKNHADIYGQQSVEGKIQYLDDIPHLQNELQAYPILTTHPYAKIIEIDASKALQMEGVKYFVSASDVPNNCIGIIVQDEEVFKSQESTSCGQFIGLILAETIHQAREASKQVIVKYEPYLDSTPILSIDDAIMRKSFYENQTKHLKTSDLSFSDFKNQTIPTTTTNNELFEMIEGYCYIGGQEHFYLEPQSCLVIPQSINYFDKSGWTIISSTQGVATTQQLVSTCLNVPMNQIQVKTPQKIGGGFGGKESRASHLACACSIGALKSGQPVRLVLDRVTDMKWSGTRNPFKGEYKCIINKETLKIESAKIDLYCNAGYSVDLSGSVLEKAVLAIDNCYSIEHLEVNGYCCKTNLSSNTAFRGFGGPQSMFVMETMIEHVADHLSNISTTTSTNTTDTTNTSPNSTTKNLNNIDGSLSMKIRQCNMYNTNKNTIPSGQIIPDVDQIEYLFNQSMKISKYDELLNDVNNFNKNNKYKKRGLSIIPSKFSIGFQDLFLNQGCTQVNIYTPDGSVLINTGGIEMGQGLYTKIVMVVSEKLGIPTELINITSANTNIIPNPMSTCGSMGTDLFAGAALTACSILNQRLLPLKKQLFHNSSLKENDDEYYNNMKLSRKEWTDLINHAYFTRVCLSAIGFIKPSTTAFGDQTWDGTTLKGQPHYYFVCGSCVCQIEIDCLTGDWIIQSIHIVMDIGDSINPAIDIGQIEGAFTQGIGLFMMEEQVWGDNNELDNTTSTTTTNESKTTTISIGAATGTSETTTTNNILNRWISPGQLFSTGPANYKIPSFNDISSKMSIHLLLKENTQANSCIYRSKAIGEPPLQLACSVLFAIRNAIKSFRLDQNINEIFTLDSPATCQKIRLLCHDELISNIITDQLKHKNQYDATSGRSDSEDGSSSTTSTGKIIRVMGNY